MFFRAATLSVNLKLFTTIACLFGLLEALRVCKHFVLYNFYSPNWLILFVLIKKEKKSRKEN